MTIHIHIDITMSSNDFFSAWFLLILEHCEDCHLSIEILCRTVEGWEGAWYHRYGYHSFFLFHIPQVNMASEDLPD